MKRILREIKLDKIAAVDRPCQEHALMTIMKRDNTYVDENGLLYRDDFYWKREFTADQRQALANKGHALPDGSFPIANKHDLENAVRAVGRAKNPARAKRHIMNRAQDMGATKLLPDSWVSKNTALTDRIMEHLNSVKLKLKKAKDALGHGSDSRGANEAGKRFVAGWSSKGGKWTAQLYHHTAPAAEGYQLHEFKNGSQVGSSWHPELKDDAAALAHFDNHVKNGFDVAMVRKDRLAEALAGGAGFDNEHRDFTNNAKRLHNRVEKLRARVAQFAA